MNLNQAYKLHTGALRYNKVVNKKHRQLIRGLCVFVVITVTLYSTVAMIVGFPYAEQSAGLAFIFGSILVGLGLFEAYFNTYYFYGQNSIIGLDDRKVTGCSYEVAEIIDHNPNDLALAFINSDLGRETLLRVGVTVEMMEAYLKEVRTPLNASSIEIEDDLIIRLERLGLLLLQRDPTFESFLRKNAIYEEQLLGALRWVGNRIRNYKRQVRWWSKDNLSKTRSLGQEWVYGQTYHLQKYAKDIRTSAVFSTVSTNSAYAKEKVEEIENTLARDLSANVLLVGEAGVGKIDLLIEISRRMARGESVQAISNQHLVVLDTTRLFATIESKQDLESTILGLFEEAQAAGNIIIVIENVSLFIKEATSVGVHVPELLDRFLASNEIHLVATDTPGAYHSSLEPLRGFTRRFKEVLVDTPSIESTVHILAGLADKYEQSSQAIFTVQALNAIAISAERYIVNGVMPDKAVQLMADVYAEAAAKHIGVISADHVYKIVTDKTGIPAGPIEDTEKETLLNLENILHKRIIGQNNAISAIARTMRRARAGIQASDRPIGSFLFLGPTGVGKTETAKALAAVFFKAESAMSRLDMSEFSDADALNRLLGDENRAGELSSLLKEHPYCVLLLDEFEKASENIHDLFLQILDEGIFTDGRGDKINARNAIIVATSNAGSALIMKTMSQRKSISVLNAEIINHIISAGILKPELINRFDSTIIFEPLMEHELASVAQLMLNELKVRVHERGYTLKLTNKLLQALIEKGYDPQFGARPMRRLIQDLIEEKVAGKIITGDVPKGGAVTLDISDFTVDELAVRAT